MKEHKFIVRPEHRAGLKLAVRWHVYMSTIFRHAIAERQKYDIGYSEQLVQAEAHEVAARRLSDLARVRK